VANPHCSEGLALRCARISLMGELTLIAVATPHSAEQVAALFMIGVGLVRRQRRTR
jgi:hypothetical protein